MLCREAFPAITKQLSLEVQVCILIAYLLGKKNKDWETVIGQE